MFQILKNCLIEVWNRDKPWFSSSIRFTIVWYYLVQLEYQTFCIWYSWILPALVVHCHQHMNGYYPFSNPSLLILKLRMKDLMYVFISTTKLTLLDFTSNDGQKKKTLLNLPYIYPHGNLDFRYPINPSLLWHHFEIIMDRLS